MSLSRHKIAVGLLATLLHQTGWAQPAATASLLEQGRYWQSHGDSKRAMQAWEKLLLAQPSQPEALYGMGLAAVRDKRTADAQTYLARLTKLDANSIFVKRLQQDVALASSSGAADLENARMLAVSGDVAKAMDAYNKALQGREPQGDIALEYYSFLGYTDNGLAPAIDGLQRLAREMPGNPNVQLALAKHLIRDENRRADGVKLLEQLSQRKDIGVDATESWRAGLVWMGNPKPAEKPLFEAFLKSHPDDTEIRGLMQQTITGQRAPAAAPWRQDPRLVRGFAALKAGDLAAAEAAFQEKLRATPNDTDALGGLGLVRMQQGDPARAQELLARAASRPGAGGNWTRALTGARYWSLVDQAESARQGGDTATARRLLEQAIRLDGGPSGAYNAMGRLSATEGDLAGAEKTYRYVLSRQKGDPDAIRGLAGVLAQNGRAEEAMRLINTLTPEQAAAVGDISRLRASVAADRANAAERRGDTAGAQRELEDAVNADPSNPWTRYELARVLLRAGDSAKAQRLMDDLVQAHPDMPDALYASTLLSSERGDWGKAYDTLARIPASARTPEMTQLQRRLRVREQAAQASRLALAGQQDQARTKLAALESSAASEPELLAAVAQAYVDAGDSARGLALMRPLVSGSAAPGPNVLIPYAGVLLKANEDAQAAGVLRQMQGISLEPDQRRDYEDLVSLYTIKQADLTRQRGDLVSAYDTLQPVLQRRPNDTLALGALARMYAAGGDREKAMGIYRQLLTRDPDNAQLQLAVAGMAAQTDDWRYAQTAIEKAVALAPNDPDILAGAARLYRENGKTGRAAELYAAAIAAEDKRNARIALASGQPAAPPNPFIGRPGQRAQSVRAAQVLGDALYEPVQPNAGGTAPFAPPAESARAAVPPPQPAGAYYGAPAAPEYSAPAAPEYSAAAAAQRPAVSGTPVQASQAGQGGTGSLRKELDDVMQDRSPEVRMGAFVRSNNGESGLSKLTETDAPFEALIPAGDGKVSLRVTPVTLDAGSIGNDYSSSSRFGGGPAAALGQLAGVTGPAGSQRDTGVGLSAGYQTRGLRTDLGTTPLGFEYSNVVGGVHLDGAIDPSDGSWYSVDVSRRAVTDSLLSFAGARDDRTGQRWGAVTASGIEGQVGTDNNDYGVYAYGSWRKLLGHNVESNSRTEAGTGIYWHLMREQNQTLTAGLNLGAIFYDNNQRFSTYGQGGYFSPQQFYSLSLPITWAQRQGRFSYKLQGSVGLQHFKEDDSDYFPNDSSLQAQAVAAASLAQAQGLGGSAVYSGQSHTGVGYNLAGAAEYQLTRQLFFGGVLTMDNATDYRQYAGGLYLRYAFYPMTHPLDLPVTPYQSPYSR